MDLGPVPTDRTCSLNYLYSISTEMDTQTRKRHFSPEMNFKMLVCWSLTMAYWIFRYPTISKKCEKFLTIMNSETEFTHTSGSWLGT